MAATRGACGWPSPPTAAPIRCVVSSKAPSMPGARVVTDDWSAYGGLRARGFDNHAIAERGAPEVAEEFLPIVHLVFSNLKNWLGGTHHGVSAKHLQAYLNEFTFRFNRRFYPFNAFRSLLGIAGAPRRRPTPSYIPARGSNLHIVAVCPNRIGTVHSSFECREQLRSHSFIKL